MTKHRFRLFLYFLIPIFAILACNAPVEEIFAVVTPTGIRPTIGPPPTLTPISLDESEFVIVTSTPLPEIESTDAPTPTKTAKPSSQPTATLIPTVTINPALVAQPTQLPNQEILFKVNWSQNDGTEARPTYNGELTLDTKTIRSRNIVYFVGNLELVDGALQITAQNCESIKYNVRAEIPNSRTIRETITVEAPCVEVEPTATATATIDDVTP